jgi:hypothetical protein
MSSAEPLRWCAHSVNGYDRNVDLKPFAKMSLRGHGMAHPRCVGCPRFVLAPGVGF